MKLIWIRHGETDSNREQRYLGHSDVPLNERGYLHASDLAKELPVLIGRPAAIYSSDLLRCMQTAEPLAAAWGLSVISEPALRELSFGEWELMTYDELMLSDPVRATRWYDDPFRNRPPHGESLEELGMRVDRWLRSLLQRASKEEASDTVVIVTHGGVIRWFQAVWLQNNPDRYWQVDGVKHGKALVAECLGVEGQSWMLQPLESKRGTT
ncbi:histidine phosphatase family protein [Brevibacillus antibioticus]|uniref:Histidine phosphatase family protein n=1 Tax=Brevibacillus antibioticus TaxID=2570228 RepID=A0A4V5TIX1_9BACL|nr:histidine phosphatase family protein [Brevibacillus antibioticus]TKI56953.1 histidine phosphatase family protein [Brevibacillus antibioticus]